MAGRLLLVCCALLGLAELATGKGNYQSTKNGKTLVWNSDPKPGDVATWSGSRNREDYAHGFGQLTWYTKERGFDEPQLYARYWGRMVNGKLEGPVNVHSKGKTDYAIFIDGMRVTGWAPGTASLRANAQWRMLVAKRRENVEPEAPAAGPIDERSEVGDQRFAGANSTAGVREREDANRTREAGDSVLEKTEISDNREVRTEPGESIQDLWSERWPKIDIDDSLRLLAFPPRSLR